jgi:EAL domain-containing protein (putative c-di-GMP-specific phosphodiesterase class I)
MPLSALRVMVVEDHGFQRRMALRLLAELGIETTFEAADGAAALAVLARLPQPPDVVLLDLNMPGMDGIELIGHLAQRRLVRALAVVSALDPALLHTVQALAEAGGLRVLGSLEKPLTADRLWALLARYEDQVLAEVAVDPVEVGLAELRAALDGGELLPWFQPQAEFGNGQVVAVEALLRWQRPDGLVVAPQHFVALLEREAWLDALTDHILAEACRWKRRWEAEGLRLRLSVNVSPSTLGDPAAADRYERIVRAHGVDPAEVVLELTESVLLADPARGLAVLARLRLKGFGLAIDDFGTGYSSLAQLSQIPFTELKIDQGFVAGAHAQPRKRAVVEASLELARKLHLEVVAEGVDCVEDWQLLAGLGCGLAQGYLIARPVPGEALAATIGRWRRPQS